MNLEHYNSNGELIPALAPGAATSALQTTINTTLGTTNTNTAATTTSLGTDGTSPPTLPAGSTGVRGWLRYLGSLITGVLNGGLTAVNVLASGTAGTPGADVQSVQWPLLIPVTGPTPLGSNGAALTMACAGMAEATFLCTAIGSGNSFSLTSQLEFNGIWYSAPNMLRSISPPAPGIGTMQSPASVGSIWTVPLLGASNVRVQLTWISGSTTIAGFLSPVLTSYAVHLPALPAGANAIGVVKGSGTNGTPGADVYSVQSPGGLVGTGQTISTTSGAGSTASIACAGMAEVSFVVTAAASPVGVSYALQVELGGAWYSVPFIYQTSTVSQQLVAPAGVSSAVPTVGTILTCGCRGGTNAQLICTAITSGTFMVLPIAGAISSTHAVSQVIGVTMPALAAGTNQIGYLTTQTFSDSTTPLSSGASFSGTARTASSSTTFVATFYSDQASAAGGCAIQQLIGGTWVTVWSATSTASVPLQSPGWRCTASGAVYRVQMTNGVVGAQTVLSITSCFTPT